MLFALDSGATPLLPDLVRVLDHGHSRGYAAGGILMFLGTLGTNAYAAIPVVTKIANSPACTNSPAATLTLVEIGATSEVCGPILSRFLARNGVSKYLTYLQSLARSGAVPTEEAMPVLLDLRQQETNSLARALASLALEQTFPEEATVDARQILRSSDSFARRRILIALRGHPDVVRRLGPEITTLAESGEREALPLVTEVLKPGFETKGR